MGDVSKPFVKHGNETSMRSTALATLAALIGMGNVLEQCKASRIQKVPYQKRFFRAQTLIVFSASPCGFVRFYALR